MAFANRCAYCGTLYEAERSSSRFCSDAHRSAHNYAAGTTHSAKLTELLRRTASAISGDAPRAVLDSLAKEARTLLAMGDSRRRA